MRPIPIPTVSGPEPLPQRLTVQIPMARRLAKRYGVSTAAHYLRKRGWSVEAAIEILTRGR